MSGKAAKVLTKEQRDKRRRGPIGIVGSDVGHGRRAGMERGHVAHVDMRLTFLRPFILCSCRRKK